MTSETSDKQAKSAVVSPARQVIELLLCTLSIYVCYLGYGLLHEKITRHSYGSADHSEKFTHSLFLTTIQCLGNSFWAVLLLCLEAYRRHNIHHNSEPFVSRVMNLIFDNVPKHKYAIVAFSYSAAMFSSTAALKFISYPIQALAKSSKLIPVMVGRILCGHKYSVREYAHVMLITGGIAIFFMFESSSKAGGPASSWIGIGLLGFSLIMDAVTGPTQEQISHEYKPTVMTMTFWINILPFLAMFPFIAATGELAAAVDFCMRHPAIIPELAVYCLLSAIGQSVIVWALFKFNSMTVTIITTTRKFFTILASVFWFQNVLTPLQWAGVLLVFIGIGADSQLKFARSRKQHHHHHQIKDEAKKE